MWLNCYQTFKWRLRYQKVNYIIIQAETRAVFMSFETVLVAPGFEFEVLASFFGGTALFHSIYVFKNNNFRLQESWKGWTFCCRCVRRPCCEPGQHVWEAGKPHAVALLCVQIRRGSFFRLPSLWDEGLGGKSVRNRTRKLHRGHRHLDSWHCGQHGQQTLEWGTRARQGGLWESPLRAIHGSDALILQQWSEGCGPCSGWHHRCHHVQASLHALQSHGAPLVDQNAADDPSARRRIRLALLLKEEPPLCKRPVSPPSIR